jgi:hypothetical protein
MSEHNFIRKVEEFAAANEGRFEPGKVHDIAVRHDRCNCDPDVSFLDELSVRLPGAGRGVKP